MYFAHNANIVQASCNVALRVGCRDGWGAGYKVYSGDVQAL